MTRILGGGRERKGAEMGRERGKKRKIGRGESERGKERRKDILHFSLLQESFVIINENCSSDILNVEECLCNRKLNEF